MYVTCSEKDFFPYSLVYFPFLQSSKSTMHSRIDIIFFSNAEMILGLSHFA